MPGAVVRKVLRHCSQGSLCETGTEQTKHAEQDGVVRERRGHGSQPSLGECRKEVPSRRGPEKVGRKVIPGRVRGG